MLAIFGTTHDNRIPPKEERWQTYTKTKMTLKDASTQTEDLQMSMVIGGAFVGGCDTSSTTNEDLIVDESQRESWRKRMRSRLQECSERWTLMIVKIRKPIVLLVHAMTSASARRPKLTICIATLISLLLAITGLLTNFTIVTDEYELWTPKNSKVVQHRDWIDDASGFPEDHRDLTLGFHADGQNVLANDTMANIERTFQVLDTIRGLEGYDALCAQSDYVDGQGKATCQIYGVTRFWNHSVELFRADIKTNEDALNVISGSWYPDLTPVIEDKTFGLLERDPDRIPVIEYPVIGFNMSGLPEINSQGLLISATMFLFRIEIPDVDEAPDFEKDVLDELLDGIRQEWRNEPGNVLRLEVDSVRSFADEFARAIEEDLPLVPFVFIMMSFFTCLVFFRCHRVQSRTLLALGAVGSIVLSLMASFGLAFLFGVPLTNITTIIPFIILGVGLDDAFILAGAYGRTDATKNDEERIYDTIEECGSSICMTTITSTTAFGLGCISSIPAIFWLCLYAFTSILLVLIYQLTFFIACIVLDEERIKQNRRDCCFCIEVQSEDEGGHSEENSAVPSTLVSGHSERLMSLYVHLLLRPWVKALVIAGFLSLFAACVVSVTKLRQDFSFVDLLPRGSYLADFFDALEDYTTLNGLEPYIYFRFVDQSDEKVQEEMVNYMHEISTIDAVVRDKPEFCWLLDFQNFTASDPGIPLLSDLLGTNLTFQELLDLFLANPVYDFLYADNIVRDGKSRNITASRCRFDMDNMDIGDIRQEMNAFKDQRSVTKSQPINKGKSDWPFFTFDNMLYPIWEFYVASVDELILTTITGIASVTAVALFLIPHWTAAVFVLPLMCMLYIDLLGCLQWAGVSINPVSYVILVLSIGLMVDYLMHVLLRYYESLGNRTEKTKEALETMGASILLGGLSTFLGAMPLVFSVSSSFMIVFYAFLGLVTLGCGHGLILLPVLLSLIGPEDQPLKDPYKREVEPQVVAEETPVVAEETPVGAEETPVGAEETPMVAEETPVGAEETPMVAEETPVGAEETPIGTEETRVGAEETHQVGAEETLVSSEETQVGAEVYA